MSLFHSILDFTSTQQNTHGPHRIL